jgi:hypothetical protein
MQPAEEFSVPIERNQGGPRITRRVTLWRRTDAGWKVLYHQGTLVEPQS